MRFIGSDGRRIQDSEPERYFSIGDVDPRFAVTRATPKDWRVDSFVKARLQEWVDRPMRILLSHATHSDRNFSVGLGLVVILAAVEIFSASFYYISRIRGGTSLQSVPATIVRRSATSVTPTSIGRAVSQTGVAPSPIPSLIDRLLTEASDSRARGDTSNAVARLYDALELDPTNASVLQERA